MFSVIWTGLGKVQRRLVSLGLIVCRGGQAGGGREGPRSNYSDKVTGQARYLPPVCELYQEHVSCSSERGNISTLITRNTALHPIVMRYVQCALQQTIKDKRSGKDDTFFTIGTATHKDRYNAYSDTVHVLLFSIIKNSNTSH